MLYGLRAGKRSPSSATLQPFGCNVAVLQLYQNFRVYLIATAVFGCIPQKHQY
jgi:hypothetical protein